MQPTVSSHLPWWRLTLPREHGAWVQLAVALLAGLRVARRPGPACGIAVAVVLLFLAREPLAVALGHRSRRRQLAEGPLRRWQAAGLAATAGVIGIAVLVLQGAALFEPHVIQQLVVAGLIGGASVWTVWTNRDRTPSGEVVAACAVASLGAVVAVVGGAAPLVAQMLLFAWRGAFALDTLAVHAAKIRMLSAAPPLWARHAWLPLLVVTGVSGLGLLGQGGPAPAATLWLVGGAGALGAAVVRRPRHLLAVGVALAAVCVLALFLW